MSSLLFRQREERANVTLPPGFSDQYPSLVAQWRNSQWVHVDQESALRHDAVWSCITKKAQDIAMLPVDVVRYVNGERQEVATPQIIAAPSVYVTDPMDWRYQVCWSWFTAGNAWGIVTQTTPDMRYPTRIELQAPTAVRVTDLPGDGMRFYVNNVEHHLWPVGDLWHSPAYTAPGQLLGLSPIAYHAQSIGVGLAAERMGSQFFNDGATPTAIFTTETDIGETKSKALKERLLELMRGNREPLILPSSIKYQQIQINPSDSQFIDTMRYSVEQVCRVYDEDPADHGSSGGDSNTYANRSDADLARYKRRQFWVTKLQNVLTGFLPRPQVVKLNTSALLMMTAKERWQIHDLRLKNKTASINGVRTLEDEKPFTDPIYDEPGIPGGNPAEPATAKLEAP